METQTGYLADDQVLWFSSDERKWITRILKLAEAHPQEVTIKKRPEENDGCIYATMPATWLKISPPAKKDLTDEQRQELAERARRIFSETRQLSEKNGQISR